MKNDKELISVIVPIYNADMYLQQCLESIVQQTYQNIEIILIDDGSTDESGLVCDEFSKKDHRVKVIHKPNSGVADCRNIGLQCSHGKYIAWVDADDYVDEHFIEYMYNALARNNSDIVQCRFVKVKDNAYIFVNEKYRSKNYSMKQVLERYAEENRSLSSIYLWDKLFKKSLFDGIEFPIRSNSEDRAVLCKILSRINIFTQIDNILYAYRLSLNSLTRGKITYEFIKSAIDTENERLDFFRGMRDISLYNKALIAYEKVMIVTYARCLVKLKNIELAEKIFVLYKRHYRRAVRYENLKFIRKVQFIFFRYFRKLYVYTVFKFYDYKMTKR